jgi:hypothetical protein
MPPSSVLCSFEILKPSVLVCSFEISFLFCGLFALSKSHLISGFGL